MSLILVQMKLQNLYILKSGASKTLVQMNRGAKGERCIKCTLYRT